MQSTVDSILVWVTRNSVSKGNEGSLIYWAMINNGISLISQRLSVVGLRPSSSLSTGCVMSLRGDCAFFCHTGSGRVGRVWSAREKSLEIFRRGWELNPGHKEDRLYNYISLFLLITVKTGDIFGRSTIRIDHDSSVGEWLHLTVCPLCGPDHDSSGGEWLYLTVCPLCGLDHDSSVGEWLYLTVCPLRGLDHDSSVGEWMHLTACFLYGPGSILGPEPAWHKMVQSSVNGTAQLVDINEGLRSTPEKRPSVACCC